MARRGTPKPMSRSTKQWVVTMRKVQLFLRILELNGAIGILVLMVLITSADPLVAWIMRIAPAVVVIHCSYGIYHLSRAAGRRLPAASSAYHLFSAFSDLAVLPLYAFGTLAVKNNGSTWTTLLPNSNILEVLIPAVYYTLISAGSLHLTSLGVALWLGFMFRRISQLPPDMNPLESHLTARNRHKRNKSSVAVSSIGDGEKRSSMPLESGRSSADPYANASLARPQSVQGVDMFSKSRDSNRDSRLNLPSRQYQIIPGNSDARNSLRSTDMEMPMDLKRMSAPLSTSRLAPGGSYVELPLDDPNTTTLRSGTPTSSGWLSTAPTAVNQSPATASPRVGKFTETWYASDSLINRTQQRNRAMNNSGAQSGSAEDRKRRTYEALNQRYDFSVDESDDDGPAEFRYDSDDTGDNPNIRADRDAVSALSSDDENDRERQANHNDSLENDLTSRRHTYHPNPLRSNPLNLSTSYGPTSLPSQGPPPRRQTPFRASDASALSELSDVSINRRSVSGNRDLTERERKHMSAPVPSETTASAKKGLSKLTRKPTTWGRRGGSSAAASAANDGGSGLGISSAKTNHGNRVSSIQPESAFYSKPYGELKSATPPIMVGPNRTTTTTNSTITAVPSSDAGSAYAAGSGTNSPRVVSSGNDFDDIDLRSRVYGRRNVSGKVAEEGRAIGGYSRYGMLND